MISSKAFYLERSMNFLVIRSCTLCLLRWYKPMTDNSRYRSNTPDTRVWDRGVHLCIYIIYYIYYAYTNRRRDKYKWNGNSQKSTVQYCVVRPQIKGTIAKSNGSSSSPIIFQQLLHQFSGSISVYQINSAKKTAKMGWNTEIKQFFAIHFGFTHLTLSCGRCSFTPPHHAGTATFVVELAAPPRAAHKETHMETINGGQTT